MAKLMNKLSGGKINPLIGSAGVSAVPMAARISENVGREADPNNHLLMHAMAAQTKIMKKLSGGIRTALAQYRELAAFSQFASDLDDATRKQLDHGQKVTELLKQKQYAPMSVAQQSLVLFAAERGYLADVELSKIGSFEAALLAYVDRDHAPLMQEINQTGGYNDEIEGKLKGILDSFKATQSW